MTWLFDCVTYIACNEHCPTNAQPFDLIIEKIEESGGGDSTEHCDDITPLDMKVAY